MSYESVMICRIYIIIEYHIIIYHSHKPGSVIHEHSHSDIFISLVLHCKFGDIIRHGSVKVEQSLLIKL